jgi:hypothetical protein
MGYFILGSVASTIPWIFLALVIVSLTISIRMIAVALKDLAISQARMVQIEENRDRRIASMNRRAA